MNITDFYTAVEDDEVLTGEGCEGTAVLVSGPQGLVRLSADAILRNDWETLRAVIVGEREPRVLAHMSRVVGYFSRIDNWNKSKLGELADRGRGDYGIADPA